jgi:hypothetical protein
MLGVLVHALSHLYFGGMNALRRIVAASDRASNAFRHASPLQVSFYVDPAVLSHVDDGLFRPARSIPA